MRRVKKTSTALLSAILFTMTKVSKVKIFAPVVALFFATGLVTPLEGQSSTSVEEADAFYIRGLYDLSLTRGDSYLWLEYLTRRIGGRLSGSPEAAAAVTYTRQMLDTLGLDRVWLQPCIVPHWVRGEPEQVRIVNSAQVGTLDLRGLALGNSIGTGPDGLTAEVVEVRSLDELETLGAARLSGKIVFFNRPFDATQLNTFSAYRGAVDQRALGASKASRYGAVGVLVRSMTNRIDEFPHTGAMRYDDGAKPIPALAISTLDAELLSRLLQREAVRVYMRATCATLAPELSYNVIGEIRGSEFPEEIILVGGHLDSWDVGQGAHDDGTGCVQAMQVLQTLRQAGYRPRRTIRCVLFMNEENGLVGGRVYADSSNAAREYHLAAIESDRGGFTPRGFSCEGDESTVAAYFKRVGEWLPLLEPYGLGLRRGGSGADISPLKSQKGLLIGYEPDSQRYFDYHHAASDVFESVNRRELELGAAAMTALVYLIDKYGLSTQ